MTPAILFEPDGYLLNGAKLMGRQSAGNGFLRAAVKGRSDKPVTGYSPFSASEQVFRQTIADLDANAPTGWIPGHRLDLLAEAGLLYRPDVLLAPAANLRLRVGPGAYALCGVTHTLSSDTSLNAVVRLVTAPMMAWDALVCTSNAALSVVSTVFDSEVEALGWRVKGAFAPPRPLFPVIPLGVHCDDFEFTAADRAAARQSLAIGPDDVVAVCAGRISVHSKAHPYPMLVALQKVATDTGKSLVLIFAGQAFNKAIEETFAAAAAGVAPRVRTLFVDGAELAKYRGAWAAGDLFISLADSIQETFGLTPIEAMAAGLPALVSDWNGYRDTVRDGVDGFRIATWAPAPGGGPGMAQRYEMGQITYDQYLYEANTAVTVDNGQIVSRLMELVGDPELRRRMGAAGKARARAEFDWSSVFARYEALWTEQTAIRVHALGNADTQAWLAAAPTRSASHLGPFDTFASFPTAQITPHTEVALASELDLEGYRALVAIPLLERMHVTPAIFERIRLALARGSIRLRDLAQVVGINEGPLAEAVSRLAKMDLLTLS